MVNLCSLVYLFITLLVLVTGNPVRNSGTLNELSTKCITVQTCIEGFKLYMLKNNLLLTQLDSTYVKQQDRSIFKWG